MVYSNALMYLCGVLHSNNHLGASTGDKVHGPTHSFHHFTLKKRGWGGGGGKMPIYG